MADATSIDPFTALRADCLGALKGLLETGWQYLALAFNPIPPADAAEALNVYGTAMAEYWHTFTTSFGVLFTNDLPGLHSFLATAFTDVFQPVAQTAATEWHGLVQTFLQDAWTTLGNGDETDPANWADVVSSALTRASLFGVGSMAVTVMFEALLPKKMNSFNWLGPMLAQLSGYAEIVAMARQPQYKAAFGRLAEYQANVDHPTRYPDESDAVTWHARGLLTDDQLKTIFGISGLRTEYQTPYINAAYRPISAFILLRMLETGVFTQPQIDQLLTYAGMRPIDQPLANTYITYMSAAPYRAEALTSLLISGEHGTITVDEINNAMVNIGIPTVGQPLVLLTISIRRVEQLAQLFRKSVTVGYMTGQVSDVDYVRTLVAGGIDLQDAQAHYGLDFTTKAGRLATAAERAAAAVARKEQVGAVRAALAYFHSGQITDAELLTALLLTGIDPALAGDAVTIQDQKLLGSRQYRYGIQLSRNDMVELSEKADAIGAQLHATLITPDAALAALVALNIPQANAQALIARWASAHISASDVGVLLPV